MLKGIEMTARDTITMVTAIRALMQEYKPKLREIFERQYKHDLLNHLFSQPYTKIEFMEEAMMVQRLTATKYLNMLVEAELLKKIKVGKANYYINQRLVDVLMHPEQ